MVELVLDQLASTILNVEPCKRKNDALVQNEKEGERPGTARGKQLGLRLLILVYAVWLQPQTRKVRGEKG